MQIRTERPVIQFLAYGAGSIIGNAVNMAALPLISRQLDTARFGTYSLGFVFFSLLILIFDLGLIQGLIRALPSSPDTASRRRLVGSVFSAVAVSSTVFGCAGVLLAAPLAAGIFGTAAASRYIVICIITAWCAVLFQTGMAWLRSCLRPIPHLVLTALRAGLFLALIFILVPRSGDKLQMLFISWMISYIPGMLIMVLVLFAKSGRPDSGLLREVFRYCLPLVPAALVMWLLTHIDIYLLRRLATLEDVGLYTLASQICMLTLPVIVAVQMGWLPFVFSAARKDVTMISPVFMSLSAAALAVGTVLILFSDQLVRLLAAPLYAAAAEAVLPLAVSAVFYIFYLLSGTGLHLAGKTSVLPLITAGAAAVNILLNILMIPRFGFTGAAWTTVVSGGGMTLATLLAARKIHPLPFPRKYFAACLLPVLAAIGISVLYTPAGTARGLLFKYLLAAAVAAAWKITGVFGSMAGMKTIMSAAEDTQS